MSKDIRFTKPDGTDSSSEPSSAVDPAAGPTPGEETWGYSAEPDAEHYSGALATREEAIGEAIVELELEPGETFYIIRGRWPDPAEAMPSAGMVIDWARDALPDAYCVEDQELELKAGGEEELARLLTDWARRNLSLSCWVSVAKAEAITVPPREEQP